MKNIIFYFFIPFVILSACDKEEDKVNSLIEQIPFVGTWSWQFEAGPGNLHTATYHIYQDSIRYKLVGNVGNADYVLQRDTFLKENNRFVGHTDQDIYYLIFAKNITQDSITLYKQVVTSLSEGLTLDVPANNTTANHGWNVYHRN